MQILKIEVMPKVFYLTLCYVKNNVLIMSVLFISHILHIFNNIILSNTRHLRNHWEMCPAVGSLLMYTFISCVI